MEVRSSLGAGVQAPEGTGLSSDFHCCLPRAASSASPHPPAHPRPLRWGGQGPGSGEWVPALPEGLLGKARVLVCLLGPPGSGAESRAVDRDATRGHSPSTPHPVRARSIPAAPASLPRRAAGAGKGARRLRRGQGGLLGSLARIKYLLCLVWPLGAGREGCSIDLELPARPGGAQGRGQGLARVPPSLPAAGRPRTPPAPTPPWAGLLAGEPGRR